jgi:hypothetical protein
MAQADSVHSTQPANTSAETLIELPPRIAGERLAQLAAQHRRAEKARQRVRKLREKAFEEIERLIAFLDASDGYTMDEREEAVDDVPCDEDELDGAGEVDGESGGDNEPWLGSLDQYHSQEAWAGGSRADLERDDSESGIGDGEGLLEQVGSQDWTHTVMG